jgi:hypothetical protein
MARENRPHPSSKELLDELASQLENLKREAGGVAEKVQDELEAQWFEAHTELFPRLCQWKELLGMAFFTTCAVKPDSLVFKPLLSDANSPQIEDIILSDIHSVAKLDSAFPGKISEMIGRAFGAREMQFDFQTQLTVLPLVLFEKVNGIFISHIPTLTTQDYSRVIHESESLLQGLRKTIVRGRMKTEQKVSKVG